MLKLRYCLILIGIALFLSATMSVSKASEIVVNDENERNNDLYITLDKCLPNKLIENNIVIVIDASGSTLFGGVESGISVKGLIDANAINIIRTINPNTNIGIIVFGGGLVKTELLSMKNETNKTYLEDFIRQIQISLEQPTPTNLDQGLLAATELLNSASGKKEIILFSDGLISNGKEDNTSFEILEKIVKDIKIKEIDINFIQIFSSEKHEKIPPHEYNKLAEAVGSRVIILNPDERAIHSKEPSLFESCSMKNNETNIITVTTRDGTLISGAEISLDNFSIGETTKGELSYTTFRKGVHYFSANKPGYNKSVIKVVLPVENITATPKLKDNQTINYEIKNEPEEKGLEKSWFESFIDNILSLFKLKS